METGRATEYDPTAPAWHGLCDAWAAASILEPEAVRAGTLNGIPFAVGDKKGLLTSYYRNNYSAVVYGSRYTGPGQDHADIHPGGIGGFHQTLINYIGIQGLPIVMDMDPGVEVWSYPVYRYEMTWVDSGNTRHVTCTVWMADNSVAPDFTGTLSRSETYTYLLDIDASGALLDSRGQWTGDSVSNHPDFMWFPTSVGGNHPYLDRNTVRAIVDSHPDGSDDRFEPNTTMQTAYPITDGIKGRFFWGNARNEDWYRVVLGKGDDFYTFMLSPANDLDIRLFDADGTEVGSSIPNGVRHTNVGADGDYYIRVIPGATLGAFYNISFFSSPSDLIPHLATAGGWETNLTLIGREQHNNSARLNLFGPDRALIGHSDLQVPENARVHANLGTVVDGSEASSARTAKILHLDADSPHRGFFSYTMGNQRTSIPLGGTPSRGLVVPRTLHEGPWYTGLAVMNTHPQNQTTVRMAALNDAGRILAESAFILAPGQHFAAPLEVFGSIPEDTTWASLTSEQPLEGFVLWGFYGPDGQAGLAGVPLLRNQLTGRTLYLPHLATYDGWTTEAAIVNNNNAPAAVVVTGYSARGTPGATRTFTIAPQGVWRGSVQALVGEQWNPGLAWARIEADQEVGGYQLFVGDNSGLAAMPLMTEHDAKTELSIKYVPELSRDWLGLALLNPAGRKTDIWAIPYDALGNQLNNGNFLWYNIPNGLAGLNNTVDVIENIFHGIPTETHTLRLFSEQPILGLGIFGEVLENRVDVLYLD
nr:hypothetical protein [Desulfatitalea alkaliphila]